MAVVHGKNLTHTIGSKAVEADTQGVDISIDVDVADATAAGMAAKQAIEGLYGWNMDGKYLWNKSSGEIDAVVFSMFSSGSQTVEVTPGGGAEGANNPSYTGSAIVKNYKIAIPHDGPITCNASYAGDGALTRDIT
jgi:hypothetical protein